MFGYSNVTFDLNVYAPYGSSGSNIKIGGKAIDPKDEGKYVAPHVASVHYSVAGILGMQMILRSSTTADLALHPTALLIL